MMLGARISPNTKEINSTYFEAYLEMENCKIADNIVDLLQKQYDSTPQPDESLLNDLSKILGLPNDNVPTLKDMDTYFVNSPGLGLQGEMCGKYNVANWYAEAFMMEYGGKIDVAWNDNNFKIPTDVYKYFEFWNYIYSMRSVLAHARWLDSYVMLKSASKFEET
eukprot:UN24271